jgi:hypothetical protein
MTKHTHTQFDKQQKIRFIIASAPKLNIEVVLLKQLVI